MIIKTSVDKERVINKLQLLNLEKPWSVEVKPYKKNRSNSQNKLYFMWLKVIGDEIGYATEELHAIMADKFIFDKFVEYGGKQIKQDKSTSRLNTKEFTEYLEKIDRFAAAELGIVLPSPDDLIYEAMGIRR